MTEFYVSGQRKVNLLFREAKGLFWYDRYKPLFESAINLAASLLLVQKFGVAGILPPTTSALLHNASTLAISLKSMTNLLPEAETAP